LGQWARGDVAVSRFVWFGRVAGAKPVTVVEDSDDLVALAAFAAGETLNVLSVTAEGGYDCCGRRFHPPRCLAARPSPALATALRGSCSERKRSSLASSTRWTTLLASCWSRTHFDSVNVEVTV
jgi:hypothetical protein